MEQDHRPRIDAAGFLWAGVVILAAWLGFGLVLKASLHPYPELAGILRILVEPLVVVAFTGLLLFVAYGWRAEYRARKRALSALSQAEECIERLLLPHFSRKRPLRYRTAWMDGQPFKVCAVYSVSGDNTDPKFPYVLELPTLKDAVRLAKTYRGTNTPVAAGRIQRCVYAFLPGDSKGSLSWMTHEWFVHDTGRIELSADWSRNARGLHSPARRMREYFDRLAMETEPALPRSTA